MISSKRGLILLAGLALAALVIFFLRQKPSAVETVQRPVSGSPESNVSSAIPAREALPPAGPLPGTRTATPTTGSSVLAAKDQQQLRVVDEVLAKSSDNDPRMDKDLKVLSAPVRAVNVTGKLRQRTEILKARSFFF
jgi:hypothetical protein